MLNILFYCLLIDAGVVAFGCLIAQRRKASGQ